MSNNEDLSSLMPEPGPINFVECSGNTYTNQPPGHVGYVSFRTGHWTTKEVVELEFAPKPAMHYAGRLIVRSASTGLCPECFDAIMQATDEYERLHPPKNS